MKRQCLFLSVALALGATFGVHAQDNTSTAAGSAPSSDVTNTSFDDRWYVSPYVGWFHNDTKRLTNRNQIYYGLGIGKFVSPNVAVDLFADRTQRRVDYDLGGGRWASNNIGVDVRYFFLDWNAWRPYLVGGVMASQHIDPFNHGVDPAAEGGVGLSKTITENIDIRGEIKYRYDWDNKTFPQRNGFGDAIADVAMVFRLGPPPAPPAPPVAPPPPQPDCSKQFRNGVNLCDNKCPDLPEGTIVGPDGCPQKVVIDLKGVNFKFDRPKKGETNIEPTLAVPSSDSLAILDQAVDTLKRYPQVHVTVAGYTDSVGTATYNQGLSERRAKIVYDYLTSHGIDASRLEGPIGHGLNDPIDTNKTAEGRARNRRTELQVQQ
ncbi:OmpA family protein [Dyella dinghuensis]|uniref:OmpA family protein n=1 Tax=Dyella dinghuensis TaxID=1920169 RepID=A0A3S0WQA3_9GAMM|nr:OmpA family protein [Dyella dinghuensis]RUL65903.1 OmpA family protein [Dyella dinghuensis]